MACWTQQEIADVVGIPRKTVDDTCGEFGDIDKLAKTETATVEHATDFNVPLYNVWKQQTKFGIGELAKTELASGFTSFGTCTNACIVRRASGLLALVLVPLLISPRVVKDNKEKRDRKIFDMWLACSTQEEISAACDCPRKTVDDQIATFGETVLGNQSAKSIADHATDFEPPIYNVWKQP